MRFLSRQAGGMKRAKLGDVRGGCKLGLAKVSFIWRSANYFSKLSLDIRTSRKLEALDPEERCHLDRSSKNTFYIKYNQVEKKFCNL